MFIPSDKVCPMAASNPTYRRNEYPCLGEMCAWFDAEAKTCGVLSALRALAPEAPKRTASTAKAKKVAE